MRAILAGWAAGFGSAWLASSLLAGWRSRVTGTLHDMPVGTVLMLALETGLITAAAVLLLKGSRLAAVVALALLLGAAYAFHLAVGQAPATLLGLLLAPVVVAAAVLLPMREAVANQPLRLVLSLLAISVVPLAGAVLFAR